MHIKHLAAVVQAFLANRSVQRGAWRSCAQGPMRGIVYQERPLLRDGMGEGMLMMVDSFRRIPCANALLKALNIPLTLDDNPEDMLFLYVHTLWDTRGVAWSRWFSIEQLMAPPV